MSGISIDISTYAESAPEPDGRRWVYERHVTTEGVPIEFSWLGVENAETVLQARAVELNRQYQEKAAVDAILHGTQIPLTHQEFRDLFPASVREAIDEFNETFAAHPGLSQEQKRAVRTGLKDFEKVLAVYRPFDSRISQMLGLYVAAGVMTQAQANEVLSHG